ncbi:hypothetical protein COLO4_19745 [Corchorus olitorius]|uniref:DUF4283 domain-containing protein n=1 Tax=Corchorus olitorius TaxID=93759 RepID=A0A1R3J3R3_9ROSI|nr:hypothetical protein COLO4_19745 [Corchorus olitorius]
MAVEQLSSFCSKLSINEGEQSKVVITKEWLEESDDGMPVYFLIGKLFAKKRANLEGMRTTLFNAWGLETGLVVKEMADKVYLFSFEEESDRHRVLVNQPWHFNRNLLALKGYDGVEKPETIIFYTCPFWIRIYELLPIMMTEKIGAAVAGAAGKVLEIDHQWGKFLRVRVLVDLLQPIMDKTEVTSPYGEIEAEFCYEDMPDFCFICGMFDHVSEGDCLLAVEMRKSQGFVTKKYSAKLKTGSPRPKSSRFDGGEGVIRVGGSGSRRSSPLSVTSSVRGGGGGSAQLAYSASSNRRPFRNHVDSLVLRGKQAARAIISDDVSCEILSHNPGRVVPPNGGGGNPVSVGPRSGERSVWLVATRGEEGSRFQEEVNELYGGLGLSANGVPANSDMRFRESVIAYKEKAKALAENQGNSSTESSASFGCGRLLGQQQVFRNGIMLGQQRSGSISSPAIPGIGGPSMGLERAGENGLGAGWRKWAYSGLGWDRSGWAECFVYAVWAWTGYDGFSEWASGGFLTKSKCYWFG